MSERPGAAALFALRQRRLAFAVLRRLRRVMWIFAGLAVLPGGRRGHTTTPLVETSDGLRS